MPLTIHHEVRDLCYPPPLRRYPSVLDVGKMVAVEYEGEAGLFHHRLILRTASTAAMPKTTGKMCVPRAPPSLASDKCNMAQREERTYPDDDDAC